jgi:hypothetical protein
MFHPVDRCASALSRCCLLPDLHVHVFVIRLCGSTVVVVSFLPKNKKKNCTFFFACSRNDWGRYEMNKWLGRSR